MVDVGEAKEHTTDKDMDYYEQQTPTSGTGNNKDTDCSQVQNHFDELKDWKIDEKAPQSHLVLHRADEGFEKRKVQLFN